MGRIVVTEFITLDGVMEDPGGANKSKYDGVVVLYYEPARAQ
jgi:hypothetical protein